MVSPAKRSQRPRRELRSDAVVEDLSPLRPNKRRRKNEEANADHTEDEASSPTVDQTAPPAVDDDVVTRVTQFLSAPEVQTQAARDHANSLHEYNSESVKAYAKVAAQDWTFYVTALVVNIGRTSEPVQRTAEEIENDKDDVNAVHIDLGPSKVISRLHATVSFDPKLEKWCLTAKGRNGLRVNGEPWKQEQDGPLDSGDVIEIGGNEMMFVLPIELSTLRIDRAFLQRAGIVKTNMVATPASSTRPARHPLPSGETPTSPSKASRMAGHKPLAPAPSDYKRPGTPPSTRTRSTAVTHMTPRIDNASTVMMGTSEVDLSLDENSHIKPQYSYAQMITQAINQTKDEKLNLNGIYNYIMNTYAYYRHQPVSGWQNSIRHNLSLNKSFEKVARLTDEPGKGMKWQIVPEMRDEMIRSAYRGGRGGHRGSSNPSSPNQAAQHQHQHHTNYINQGPRDMVGCETVLARKRKVSLSGSPQPRSMLREMHSTPVRNPRKILSEKTTLIGNDSPIPLPQLQLQRAGDASSTLGLPENAPGSPTLTSSYQEEAGSSFVTPAPLRVHPRLAPPSTAQRPSQHMPTSSPAPFWKYADIHSTPLKPGPFDMSPSRNGSRIPDLPQSSSPPPAADKSQSPAASPTRPSRAAAADATPAEFEEEAGFDLTKGFQSIGSFHAPVGQGQMVRSAANVEGVNGSMA